MRPNSHAMVNGAERRLHQKRQAVPASYKRWPLRISRIRMSLLNDVTRILFSIGWNALSECARKFLRSAGATFHSSRRERRMSWRCGTTGETTRSCASTISAPNRVKCGSSLAADDEAGCALVNLLSDEHSQPEKGGVHRVLLEAYGYRWYRVCGLDYLLKRSAI